MKIQRYLSPLLFLAFLVILFNTTQMVTRSVISRRVQAAGSQSDAVTFVRIDPAERSDTFKLGDAIRPEEAQVLQPQAMFQDFSVIEPIPVAQTTIAPLVQTVVPKPLPAGTVEPPQQGSTCISGKIIDHFHQRRGAGWQITVNSGNITRTGQANGDGEFHIGGLPAGVWQVSLNIPDNSLPFTASTFPVTLSGDKDAGCAKVRFKIDPPGCVDIIKLDQNGPRPNTGIPGWKFIGTHNSGKTVEGTTNGLGQVRFENLLPGTWTFEEEAQEGWVPVEGQSRSQTVTLIRLENPLTCVELKFVNRQKHDTCLIVRKTDTQDNRLPGWQIDLIRDDGTFTSQSETTNEQGEVTFSNLPLGNYTVIETLQAGYLDAGQTSVPVTLTKPNPICQVITFKNPPSTCIDGHKINHLNMGLAGWVIKATHKETNQMFSATTNNSGYFVFPQLPLGTYVISETLQAGWESVTPTSFEVAALEPRLSGECYPVRFKNRFPYACLDVYKLDAYDGAGLPDWEITLKPAYGGQPVTIKTDGTGHANFSQLTPGEYIVSEANKTGWFAVTPQSVPVTLEATGTCEIVTFQNCQELTGKSSEQCQSKP